MKHFIKYPLLAFCFCFWSGSLAALQLLDHADVIEQDDAPVGGLIVKFYDQSLSGREVKERVKGLSESLKVDLRYQRRMSGGAHVLQFNEKVPLDLAQTLSETISARPDVEYAEPNVQMQIQFVPDDPDYEEQWHYFETTGGIDLPSAWDISTGENVVVAVIDTGYRPHTDLADNILPGFDFITDVWTANDGDGPDDDAQDPGDWVNAWDCGIFSPSPRDSSWHGTHVAGTIAALTDNGFGVSGVAFNARILPVRVLGRCGGTLADIADGIRWSVGLEVEVPGVPNNPNPAQVINMSLGGDGACSMTFREAIDDALRTGATVVVAAGNADMDARNYQPASCPGVIAVAATNRTGSKAYYSNFGDVVDLAAPGGETDVESYDGVLSTLNSGQQEPVGDDYEFYAGTSMAAPHVTGVAALLYSLDPSITPNEVEMILAETTREFPGRCDSCGTGILDAGAAVRGVYSGSFWRLWLSLMALGHEDGSLPATGQIARQKPLFDNYLRGRAPGRH